MFLHCSLTLLSPQGHPSSSDGKAIFAYPPRMTRAYVTLLTIWTANQSWDAGTYQEFATNLKIGSHHFTSDTSSNTTVPHARTWKNMRIICHTLPTMSCLLKRTVPRTSPWMNSLHLLTCGVGAHSSGSTSCRRCAIDPSTFAITKFITSLLMRPFKLDRSTQQQGSGLGIKSFKTRSFVMAF